MSTYKRNVIQNALTYVTRITDHQLSSQFSGKTPKDICKIHITLCTIKTAFKYNMMYFAILHTPVSTAYRIIAILDCYYFIIPQEL